MNEQIKRHCTVQLLSWAYHCMVMALMKDFDGLMRILLFLFCFSPSRSSHNIYLFRICNETRWAVDRQNFHPSSFIFNIFFLLICKPLTSKHYPEFPCYIFISFVEASSIIAHLVCLKPSPELYLMYHLSLSSSSFAIIFKQIFDFQISKWHQLFEVGKSFDIIEIYEMSIIINKFVSIFFMSFQVVKTLFTSVLRLFYLQLFGFFNSS